MIERRRILVATLAAVMALPPFAGMTGAAETSLDDPPWISSEDGAFWAYDGAEDGGPSGLSLERRSAGDRPAPLQSIDAVADFYSVSARAAPDDPVLVARLHDTTELPFVSGDELPVIPLARIDDQGGTWLETQGVLRLPPRCPDEATDAASCLRPSEHDIVLEALLDGRLPLQPGEAFAPHLHGDTIVTQGVMDQPGDVFGFGSAISVSATVTPGPGGDGAVIEATVDIGDAFGGEVIGFGADVIELPSTDAAKGTRRSLISASGVQVGIDPGVDPGGLQTLGGDCCADLEERVAELEATTARKGNRRVSLELSGNVQDAVIVWDVAIEGVGSGLGDALGLDGLSGGTTILATDAVLGRSLTGTFDLADPDLSDTTLTPGAGLVCVVANITHEELNKRLRGGQVVFPSQMGVFGIVWVVGTPEDAERHAVRLRIDGVDRGRDMRAPLMPISPDLLDELDGYPGPPEDFFAMVENGSPPVTNGSLPGAGAPPRPDRFYWFGVDGGLESFGRTRVRDVQIIVDGVRLPVTRAVRRSFGGNRFGVSASEERLGDCPADGAALRALVQQVAEEQEFDWIIGPG